MIRNTAGPIAKDKINKKLLQLKVNIINAYNGLNGSFHLIDKNWLTNIANKTINKSITQNQITLLSFIDNYMERIKNQPSVKSCVLCRIS